MKILYLHGLESGPNGVKVGTLRAHFGEEGLHCEDMHMSVLDVTRRNSVLRNVIRGQAPILGGGLFVGLVGWAAGWFTSRRYALYGVFLYALYFLIFKRRIIAAALSASLEASIEAQAKAIEMHSPDILVGSSFGGAVVIQLLHRKIWSGPSIAMCPAHHKITRIMREVPAEGLGLSSPLLLLHGDKDAVVPLADSIALGEANDLASVRIVPNGCHSLTEFVATGELVRAVLAFGRECNLR